MCLSIGNILLVCFSIWSLLLVCLSICNQILILVNSPWKCRGTWLLPDCGRNLYNCFVSFSTLSLSLSLYTLSAALDSQHCFRIWTCRLVTCWLWWCKYLIMLMLVKNIIGDDYCVNIVWWVMHCRVLIEVHAFIVMLRCSKACNWWCLLHIFCRT